ncbi:hypothetical protein D3C81_544020 [compost metagenome]
MGQYQLLFATLHRLGQLQRLGIAVAQRLVADDVDAGVKKRGRHRRMQIIGGDDSHHIDAVFARRLFLRHLVKIVIAALWVEV